VGVDGPDGVGRSSGCEDDQSCGVIVVIFYYTHRHYISHDVLTESRVKLKYFKLKQICVVP